MVQASEEGDRLSDTELRAMTGGLLFAGFDTTRNQLGQALFAFCQHPEQWEILARNPDLAPRAVNGGDATRGSGLGHPPGHH